jgi:hypothetical protein
MDDGVDLLWLMNHGAAMAWQYAMAVQTCLTDMTAAYDDGDHGGCVESCMAALRAIAYCERVSRGYVGRPSPVEHHTYLAIDDSPASVALRDLPLAGGASDADARAAMRVVREHDERLRELLPVTTPVMRSAAGFFPVVGIAAALEKLRAEHGLSPMNWNHWGI